MQDCYIDYNEKFTKRKGGKQKMPHTRAAMPDCLPYHGRRPHVL